MGTLNVIVEQKRCKCARASESGGKQGWQSREGVKADWEKQRRPQPGMGEGRWVGEGREEERKTQRGKGRAGGGLGEEGTAGREGSISWGGGFYWGPSDLEPPLPFFPQASGTFFRALPFSTPVVRLRVATDFFHILPTASRSMDPSQ